MATPIAIHRPGFASVVRAGVRFCDTCGLEWPCPDVPTSCASVELYASENTDGACCRAWANFGFFHSGPCCSDPTCEDCGSALVAARTEAARAVFDPCDVELGGNPEGNGIVPRIFR